MFDQRHYVPILKGRDGEYGALQMLSPEARDTLTPLLEVPPIPWDFEEEKPARTIDKHLRKVARKIQRSWGPARSMFLDLLWISESERMPDGEHPVRYLFRSGRDLGLFLIPVLGLLRGDDHLRACREVSQQDRRGVCVRLQREDFVDFGDLSEPVGRLLETVGVSAREAQLLLDIRALTPSERDISTSGVQELIGRLPMLTQWGTFTVAATSFPQNLMGLPPAQCSMIPRREWSLWRDLQRTGDSVARYPTFGDYAISHPEPAEVDPRVMRPSASVRYTCEDGWLILKARNLRDHGYEQFHEVCRELIKTSEYRDPGFSWGDGYIADCAAERVGTGNLTTWRKVGTSHHIAFVVHQLATGCGS